ncbi:uncharacterized protein LOC122866493 isoform X3 [Xyrichtys novacula]|uniref:Uncharacterized protein LOC122866493 isoform X3 n=1 Tax=Xyrichtys novacula TaxID=13765 RepID=A0AAV1HBG4_XYRNO|nr:uncharacterized protein LOC122866493 isoform X3 [Xyrichtys novacula]
MSFSFCCGTPSEEGFGRTERRLRGEEEESRRRKRNISELREEYRSSRERQRRNPQVVTFRTVSSEPSATVNIVPVTQTLTSDWGSYTHPLPAETFDQDPTTCDPWLAPLGLHLHSCSRRSLSSSKATSSLHLMDLSPDPTISFSDSSTFSSSSSDEDHVDSSRSRRDPVRTDPVIKAPGSARNHPHYSCTDSDETFITCSPIGSTSSLHADLKEIRSAGRNTSNSSSAWKGSWKFSVPALRLTRQLSVREVGYSSPRVHQNQNYTPFPYRRTRRIPEAVRRLGMYSSF